MFMGFCALLALAAVPLLGGDLRRLADLRPRGVWLVFAALAVQILVISVLPEDWRTAEVAAHDLTYVAALAVIAVNWRIPGMVIIGLGTFCNGFTIAINGGTLPASAAADATVNFHRHDRGLLNSGVLAHPHLAWLGDRFASPAFLPLRNVMSIGDLLILAGVVVLVLRVTGVTWRTILRRREPSVSRVLSSEQSSAGVEGSIHSQATISA
jgi:hypothetical protein